MPEVKEIEQGEKNLEGLTEEELEKLIEEKKEDYDYYINQLKIDPDLENKNRFLYSAIKYHKLLVKQVKNELEEASKKLPRNLKTLVQYPLLVINNNTIIRSRKRTLEYLSGKLKIYTQNYNALSNEKEHLQVYDPRKP